MFFVIWGEKKQRQKLGYVADLCPICRTPRELEVSRVSMANHVYFIPLGQGKTLGYLGRCQQCGTDILVDPLRYNSVDRRSNIDFETLVQSTFPTLRTVYAERLQVEDKLKNRNPVSIPNRGSWLMEPFGCLVGEVEDRYANARFDQESGVGCLGTILLLASLNCGLAAAGPGLTYDILILVMSFVAMAGLAYTVIQIALAPNRYVQRSILPRLVRSLRPLNPTPLEISQCISELRTRGFRLGRKIQPEKLWEALQKNQALTG